MTSIYAYLRESVPPPCEPLSLDETKAHLRVTGDAEDVLISGLIRAARAACEDYTGRALMARTYILSIDTWPCDGVLRLPRPPFIEVVRIDVKNSAGVAVEYGPAGYEVDNAGRIVIQGSLPTPGRETGGIEVVYRAGYGENSADVPEALRTAMKQLVARLYERRGDGDAGALPAAARAVFQSYRVMGLG